MGHARKNDYVTRSKGKSKGYNSWLSPRRLHTQSEPEGARDLLMLLQGSGSQGGNAAPLSTASTNSGPPSPGLLTSPSNAPMLTCDDLFLPASAWPLGSPNFRSTKFGGVAMPTYLIYGEGQCHPETPVLRVRRTFIEAHDPPELESRRIRRCKSVPPLGTELAWDKIELQQREASLQSAMPPPPKNAPPVFQSSPECLPPPSNDPVVFAETLDGAALGNVQWPSDYPQVQSGVGPDLANSFLCFSDQVFDESWPSLDSMCSPKQSGDWQGYESYDVGEDMSDLQAMEPLEGYACSKREMPNADLSTAYDIIHTAHFAPHRVWELAQQSKVSSANVQGALVIAAQRGPTDGWRDAWALVGGLRGHIRQAYNSPFANYVLSKIFQVMPTFIISGVAKELQGYGGHAAKHRFGCRCIRDMIHHHAKHNDRRVSQVINEVIAEAGALACHDFGTHPVRELLDRGLPEQQDAVEGALQTNILILLNNRHGIPVLKRVIRAGHAGPTVETLCSISDYQVCNAAGRRLLRDARVIAMTR